MGTEKQKQRRHDGARLTESANARSEQLNTPGAHRVTNQQSLACLSGSERRRPGWFLDMKYQTCFVQSQAYLYTRKSTHQGWGLISVLPLMYEGLRGLHTCILCSWSLQYAWQAHVQYLATQMVKAMVSATNPTALLQL